MSTDLGEVEGPDGGSIKVTRFFGGKRRGIMYQLTEVGKYAGVRGDYVQVSATQLLGIRNVVCGDRARELLRKKGAKEGDA